MGEALVRLPNGYRLSDVGMAKDLVGGLSSETVSSLQ